MYMYVRTCMYIGIQQKERLQKQQVYCRLLQCMADERDCKRIIRNGLSDCDMILLSQLFVIFIYFCQVEFTQLFFSSLLSPERKVSVLINVLSVIIIYVFSKTLYFQPSLFEHVRRGAGQCGLLSRHLCTFNRYINTFLYDIFITRVN